MLQVLFSLVAIYLMWNVFTFKYDGVKSILIIIVIALFGIITGFKMVVSVACLAGMVTGAYMVIKHLIQNVVKFFHKGVR